MLKAAAGPAAYACRRFANLQAALTYLHDHEAHVDAIISGVNLPDASAAAVFDALGEIGERLPVIYVAAADEDLAVPALQEGAQDFLLKGQFDGAILARSIRYAIERKKIE